MLADMSIILGDSNLFGATSIEEGAFIASVIVLGPLRA